MLIKFNAVFDSPMCHGNRLLMSVPEGRNVYRMPIRLLDK